MASALPQELVDLLNDPESTRLLATVDEQGRPHLVVKQSLQLDDDGRLIYLELLERSRSNRNMLGSLWFGREVAIAVVKGEASYQVKGRPVQSHIAGPLFRKHYLALRERHGDLDLAAVWEIEPEQVIDQRCVRRVAEESAREPYFNHLDRLVKG